MTPMATIFKACFSQCNHWFLKSSTQPFFPSSKVDALECNLRKIFYGSWFLLCISGYVISQFNDDLLRFRMSDLGICFLFSWVGLFIFRKVFFDTQKLYTEYRLDAEQYIDNALLETKDTLKTKSSVHNAIFKQAFLKTFYLNGFVFLYAFIGWLVAIQLLHFVNNKEAVFVTALFIPIITFFVNFSIVFLIQNFLNWQTFGGRLFYPVYFIGTITLILTLVKF